MSSVLVSSFTSSSAAALPHFMGFGIPSGPDLFILLIIVLILFGRDRLPGVAKSLGESIKEFKKAMHELEKDPTSSSPAPAAPAVKTPVESPDATTVSIKQEETSVEKEEPSVKKEELLKKSTTQ